MKRALLSVAAAVALASCTYLQGDVDPYRPPGLYPVGEERLESGLALYQRDCAFCHGNDGGGTARGLSLRDGTNGAALTDFMLRTGRMPISDPDEPTLGRDPVYDERQIDALVAFVEDEFDPPGPEIPGLELAAAELPLGQQLYQEHCVACHATTGIGGAMLVGSEEGEHEGVTIPGLGRSSEIEVAEAVRTGPGTMPVFPETVLDEEELSALVRYTMELRDPNDKGGFGLGHIGPVAEGAAGWLLGLGTLLLFIRWIGTKAGE